MNLNSMVHELVERPGERTSYEVSKAIDDMAMWVLSNAQSSPKTDLNGSGLLKELEQVEELQKRSAFGRHLRAEQDLEGVEGCRRRVETLTRELQVSVLCPART